MKPLIPIGILLLFLGIVLIFIGSIGNSKSDTKVAVGGFVGFIPFGFANDKKTMSILMAFMAAMAVLFFLFKRG